MSRLAFLTALTLCAALPVYTAMPAQAQGYSGLFAPAPEEQKPATKNSAPAADAPAAAVTAEIPVASPVAPAPKRATTQGEATYSGLIAPPKNAPKQSAIKQNPSAAGDSGYAALVAATPKPAPAPVNMTRIPAKQSKPTRDIYINGSKPLMNASDLRTAALFNRLRQQDVELKPHAVNGKAVDSIVKLTTAEDRYAAASGDTVGATERRVDKAIRRMTKEVNDPALTAEQRKARANAAYQELLRDSDGLIALGNATTPIYARFGVSEGTANKMASDESKALSKVQAAIRKFDELRK